MAGYSFWVYRNDKTPKTYTMPVKTPRKSKRAYTNHKYIFVESLYTDKKLGLNKRKGYKKI
jgi:hypothetical protein